MLVLTCYRCKEEKEETEFPFKNKAKGIRSSECKPCRREVSREHYQKNKKQYIDRAQYRINDIKLWYQELKKEYGCSLCNESEPCAIDHHHLSGKEFSAANIVSSKSLKVVVKELNKGIFLCSNCHRKVHAGVVVLSEDTTPLNISVPNVRKT